MSKNVYINRDPLQSTTISIRNVSIDSKTESIKRCARFYVSRETNAAITLSMMFAEPKVLLSFISS
ncbi:Uncharacterised protein [Legionella spiritensis]|nr:Uncharacterised protein [Legionella spiritensis]